MNEKLNISLKKERIRALCRVLGDLSGTYDSIVCRIYPVRKKNGRIVYQQRFATLPAHYRVNNRKDLAQNRSRFRINNIFSSFVNRIPELKEIWKKYGEKKNHFSAYTAISKENFNFNGVSAPGELNMILPPAKEYDLLDKSEIAMSEERIKISNLPEGKLVAVISLIDPKSTRSAKFRLFTIKGEVKEGVMDISTPAELSGELKNYKRYILYFTVINENKAANYFPVKGKVKFNVSLAKRANVMQTETKLFWLYPPVAISKEAISHSPPVAA
jgi:hypothetical protein